MILDKTERVEASWEWEFPRDRNGLFYAMLCMYVLRFLNGTFNILILFVTHDRVGS